MSSSPERSSGKARARTGLITRKLGMTRFFDGEGAHVPVTVLSLDGCQVVGRRTAERDGYDAVCMGAGAAKAKNTPKPQRVDFGKKAVGLKAVTREFRVKPEGLLEIGAEMAADHFLPGQLVDVRGVSIGKGFAGAMKRWNFRGLRASHGVSVAHRSHGSTGQRQDPGRTFPGKKMAGALGGETVTTQNLKVFRVDAERGLIMVVGSVPGAEDSWVEVRDAVKRPLPDAVPRPGALRNTRATVDPPYPLTDRGALTLPLDRMREAWARVATGTDRRGGVYDLYFALYDLLKRGPPNEAVDDGLGLALHHLPATATELLLDEDRSVARAGALLLSVLLAGPDPDLKLRNEDDWGEPVEAAVRRIIEEHVRDLPIRFVTQERLRREKSDDLRLWGRVEVFGALPGLELAGRPVDTAVPAWAADGASASLDVAPYIAGERTTSRTTVDRLELTPSARARRVLAAFEVHAHLDITEPLDEMSLRLRPVIAGRALNPLWVRLDRIPV